MRLLQLEDGDRLSLTEDLMSDVPPYAILSHTWGRSGDEVTLQDVKGDDYQSKPGFRKILFCGEQARRDGIEYFWVDTCCIDRTSSAELTEAVNSMYRWYHNAQKCYVYLSDLSTSHTCHEKEPPSDPSWEPSFRNCRWFTRGWTLQELIAPPNVEFFSRDGQKLGDKKSLEDTIREITGIPSPALQGEWEFSQVHEEDESVSWLYNRETTRPEDKAYSLLGLIGVSMAVIYGEGEESAYMRLYREIIQQYPQYSAYTLFELVIHLGHSAMVPTLFCKRGTVNSRDSKGFPLLGLAAMNGRAPIVQMLLDNGADIELKDNGGWTALAWAADKGHDEVVRILLAAGADIESRDKKDWTPLTWAAERGQEGAVRILLAKGANIEAKDNGGYSPLAWAADRGHEGVVRLLLESGADIESKDLKEYTPLGWAAENGHDGVVRLLLDNGANFMDHPIHRTPLALARKAGHAGVVRMLQSEGEKVNPDRNASVWRKTFAGKFRRECLKFV